ncbi:MAG TPA: LCP family protein [Streptosporangiaceae bacterium]|nr:LCP family protein [Streptosporangiaceae bacterium]
MFSARSGTALGGKVGYAVSCALAAVVLVTSGFAYYVKAKADSLGGSNVLSGGPSTGPMNILLMGLESRTYWSGQPLPRGLEDIMHIGSIGGNATNTLILLHIFAGGQKAVGISIPRDDWVTMAGTGGYGGTQGKIDQAYGFAMAHKMSQLAQQNPGMSSATRNFLGNEAGRLAAVQTVEQLTGVHIDHFAEMNLAGFYGLAKATKGIEACIKPTTVNGVPNANLYDTPSGWNAVADGYNLKKGGAQYLHLAAAQALAFIRDRDSLPNGDLDRTHRQQAVLDYVIWKLGHQGVLSDISQLNSLLAVAKQYLITSGHWDLLQFAGEMKSLTGKNLTFHTLPVLRYQTINGQAANVVNPASVKQFVHNAFYPAPASAGSTTHSAKPAQKKSAVSLAPGATTVDVYNGGYTTGLASHLSQALTSAGYKAGKVGNITARSSTQVLYGTGAAASAAKIAGYFNGVTASASSSVAAGHVDVLLGTDATSVPSGIGSSSAPGSGSSPVASSSSSSSSSASKASKSNGASGGVVTVKANAPYGIPCVY